MTRLAFCFMIVLVLLAVACKGRPAVTSSPPSAITAVPPPASSTTKPPPQTLPPVTFLPAEQPGSTRYPDSWTVYTGINFITSLEEEKNQLWVGTRGGV